MNRKDSPKTDGLDKSLNCILMYKKLIGICLVQYTKSEDLKCCTDYGFIDVWRNSLLIMKALICKFHLRTADCNQAKSTFMLEALI